MSIIFHKQLASIMEVLTSAAVTEISKLVDDGYAVLRLEMSRYVEENEALRKRLRMMELRVSRPCPERADALENSVNKRRLDVQVCQVPGATKESLQALGKRLSSHLHAGGQTSPAPGDNAPEQPATSSHKLLQCADMEEGSSESVIIKKEELEEERHPLGEINAGDERAVEWRSGSREKRPVQEMQNKAANHTEELTEQHRTRRAVWECTDTEEGKTESFLIKEERLKEDQGTPDQQAFHPVLRSCDGADGALALDSHSTPDGAVNTPRDQQEVWEVSGPEATVKFEPENNSVTKRLQHTGTEHWTESLNSVDSDFVMFERPGRVGSCCPPGGAVTETEDPCCSYSAEMDSESLPFHSELPPGSPAEEQGFNGLSSLHANPRNTTDSVMGALKNNKLCREVEDRETARQEKGDSLYTRQGNQVHSKSEALTSVVSRLPDASASKSSCRAATGEKIFICTYCGKTFSRSRNLENHLRVHTGEKPFGCTRCGKNFSQLNSLKIHLSLHTGERPFRCTQCGKCFAHPSYLKRHQIVHTGEKPFKCTQCEKSFSFSSNLIRHQGLHTGGKLFTNGL